MSAILSELVPGVRVIEAHGRHDDLETRIDAFRQKKVIIMTMYQSLHISLILVLF